MLLSREVILAAARSLLEMAIGNEIEDDDANASLPEEYDCADDLAEFIIENHEADVLLTMGCMIGAIGQAWGSEIGLVFHHMEGLDDEAQSSALYRLIMSCFGHGIGIDDDGPSGPMASAFDNAGKILCNVAGDQGKRFKPSPTDFDQHQHFTSELVDRHLVYAERED